jgi:hypothetical protein
VYVAGYYDNQIPGTEEVTDISCVADSSGNLDGTYFVIYNFDGESEEQYYMWYAVDGYANTDPGATGTGIRVDILENATADDVAIETSMSLYSWDTSVLGNNITVTSYEKGDVTDASNVTVPGAFSISVTTQGTDTVYDYQWWIKKFDADGNEDTTYWDKKIDTNAEEESGLMRVVLALDSSDNLYAAGATYTDDVTYFDWMIKKYSSEGTEDLTWDKTFLASGWGDEPLTMTFDSSDNLYVVGMQDKSTAVDEFDDLDWWIKKFSSSGVEDTSNWDMVLDNVGGLDASLAVGIDSLDYVYVTGVMADAPAGSPEVTEITCFGDSSGSLGGSYFTINQPSGEYYVWYQISGYPYSDPMVAGKDGIQITISENALAGEVATETSNILPNYGFDTSILGSVVTVENCAPGNVTDAADGPLTFATGFSFSITDGVDDGDLDWVVKKYSSTGTELWSELIDFGNYWNLPYSMAIDSDDNIYVVGYREISDEQENWVIKKLDSDGNEDTMNWDKSLNSGNGSWEEAYSVIVDSEDNVYVTGGMWNGPDDGIPEETVISCVSDSGGSLDGTYFELYNTYEEYYIWYAVSGYSNTDPGVSGKTGIQVDIVENATSSDVASLTASVLNAFFDVSSSVSDVTVINYSGGDVTDAANGTPGPGFSFSITDGVDPGDMDWVIKKFNSSGTELWSKEFDAGSGNDDEGYAGAAFR